MNIIDLLRAGSLSRSADEIIRLQALVEKAEARAEELTHALARVALDFGADPDILGGLWESSDCIKWMVKVQASLKAKGITIAWGTETHEPVVMDAHAEKAEAQLALEVEDHARDNRDNRGTSRGLEAEIHQLKERRSQLALQVNDHRSQAESLLSRWGELSRERDHLAERCKLVDEMTTRTEKAEQLAADLAGIPKVAGHLRISLAEMIRNAGTLLTEAEITAAHVPLAPFLCDVIRVCREYGDAMQVRT